VAEPGKRVIVCGGRDYADRARMQRTLFLVSLDARPRPLVIVHGAAPGADTLADQVAREFAMDVEPHPADWSRGRSAGPIRNAEMLAAGADLVIAFPGGRGTADMVRRAKRAGVPVREIPARWEVEIDWCERG